MAKFRNDLVEVYRGFYENEIALAYRGRGLINNWKAFEMDWIERKIGSHSNEERLGVYLEWNGIIGYDSAIYDIATEGGML